MLAVVLAGFAGLVAGAGIVWLACGREVRRMARFLRERDARSNARLTVEAPGRSFAELASAVNGQLDAAQEERVAARRQQQEFQRDLASLSHDIRTPLMGAKGYLRLAQDVGAGFEGVAEAAGPHAEDAEGTAEAERAAGPHAEDAEAARLRRLAAAEARLDDMRALLDQLFAYAQANDPDLALDLRPVRVLPVLADVLVGQYPAFERQGWEPHVDFQDEALLADADPEALARIFENLVVNAPWRLCADHRAARRHRDVCERGVRPRGARRGAPVRTFLPRRRLPHLPWLRLGPCGRRQPRRGHGHALGCAS